MNIGFNTDGKSLPKRTFMLWFLAICTMLNNVTSGLTYFFYGLFPKILRQSVEVMSNMPMFDNEQYRQAFDTYLSIAPWQYLLLFVMCAMAFAGALIMLWKLKPLGFHLYTISQIYGFCVLNLIIGGKLAMGWNEIIWTIMIVIIYALQLRFIQQFKDASEQKEKQADADNNNDIDLGNNE